MEFNELFNDERDKNLERCRQLEESISKLQGDLKASQFLLTRVLVEQRELADRMSDLESVCASFALNSTIRGLRNRERTKED